MAAHIHPPSKPETSCPQWQVFSSNLTRIDQYNLLATEEQEGNMDSLPHGPGGGGGSGGDSDKARGTESSLSNDVEWAGAPDTANTGI